MGSRYFTGSRLPPGALDVIGLGKRYQDKISWLRRWSTRFGDTEPEEEEPNGKGKSELVISAEAPTWALRDVTFSLRPGDRLAVLGSAGAGKSTIIQVLAGHLAPSEGVVEGAGIAVPLSNVITPVIPNRTGHENLLMLAQLLRIPRERLLANMDRIVEFSELGPYLHRHVRKYSKSMFQQLGLAMALNIEPNILLIDDGVAARNQGFYYKALDRIAELLKQGTSLVYATGREAYVREWCSRGIILTSGRVSFSGMIEEACKRQFGRPS